MEMRITSNRTTLKTAKKYCPEDINLDVALQDAHCHLALIVAIRTLGNALVDEPPDELRDGLAPFPALANQLRAILKRHPELIRVNPYVLLIRHDLHNLSTLYEQVANAKLSKRPLLDPMLEKRPSVAHLREELGGTPIPKADDRAVSPSLGIGDVADDTAFATYDPAYSRLATLRHDAVVLLAPTLLVFIDFSRHNL